MTWWQLALGIPLIGLSWAAIVLLILELIREFQEGGK